MSNCSNESGSTSKPRNLMERDKFDLAASTAAEATTSTIAMAAEKPPQHSQKTMNSSDTDGNNNDDSSTTTTTTLTHFQTNIDIIREKAAKDKPNGNGNFPANATTTADDDDEDEVDSNGPICAHSCDECRTSSSSSSFSIVEDDETNNDLAVDTPTRYADGSVRLRNQHIELMDQDILYHLALGSESHDLVAMFHDVKFVCIGGTPKRMEEFAYFIMREIGHKIPTGTQLLDISQYSYRYSMYKVGPVLSVSHGMGIPSVSILMHEIIKLMYHAKAKDPVFFRIGTCGGIGIDGGSVIVTEEALNGELKPYHELSVLGKKIRRTSKLDKRLQEDLLSLASERDDPYDTVTGKTMCTDDFYEGQARLDGCICEYSEKEKMSYLCELNRNGVSNIEMESLAFAALTHHAGIRAAVVCVSLLDRLKGDQILAPKEVLQEWQLRPQILIARYIKKELGLQQQRKSPVTTSIPCLCPHAATLRVKSPRRIHMVQQESESYD